MAVAHESATESHTGTTGSTSEDFFDISVPFTANSKGLLFLSFENTASDLTSAVTIDPAGANTDVPIVTGGRAVDTLTELGDCKAWFLGSGLPTTTTTVRITRTNNSGVIWAVAITVTAGGDTEVFGVLLEQENQALTEENVDDGSPGTNSVRYAGVNSGRGAVVEAGANSTLLHDIDFGTRVASTVRETTAGQGSRPVGFVAVDDDVAAVYLAVREVAGSSPQNLSGALFTKAPTFFTGVVGRGAVALTGTLFTKAPTFNTGAITATYALTGTLFAQAPTFFTGTVTSGAVGLTGSLFTNAPVFFAGEVTNEGGTQTLDGVLFQSTPTFNVGDLIVEQFLTGTLFQNTPTFFAGAVTTGEVSVSGVLFVNTPTFNVGTVAASYDLDGTLFVNTPTFFQGEVAASYDLTGTLFTKAPTFFAGEVAPGEVTLSGVLFQNTPVFEQGVLSQEGGPIFLTGTLFQKAPTFPQGTVTPGGVSLTGVLFQSTPTFNAGDVTSSRDLAGVLFQQAPMFFQGDVSLRGLAGELFVSAPVFFVGTITQPVEVGTNWPVSTPAPWPGTDSIGWPVSKESEWQGV